MRSRIDGRGSNGFRLEFCFKLYMVFNGGDKILNCFRILLLEIYFLGLFLF